MPRSDNRKKKQDLELPLKIIDYKTKFHFCCSTERIYNFRLFSASPQMRANLYLIRYLYVSIKSFINYG